MLEALTYTVILGAFCFVLIGSARMAHEFLILACIPPVFVAVVFGFFAALYVWDSFGAVPLLVALGPGAWAWWLSGRYRPRDQLIFIYLAWVIGLVASLIGLGFPDQDGPPA